MTEIKKHSGSLPRIRLVGKTQSSLSRHIRWFEYLESREFDRDFRERFESRRKIQQVKSFGLQVINRLIYSAYRPKVYKRSFALRKSFSVDSDNDNANPNITAFFDLDKRGNPTKHNPEGSPEAKLLPGHAYAAFFQFPSRFRSFLPKETRPFRPFTETIVRFMADIIPQHALDTYEKVINRKKPS